VYRTPWSDCLEGKIVSMNVLPSCNRNASHANGLAELRHVLAAPDWAQSDLVAARDGVTSEHAWTDLLIDLDVSKRDGNGILRMKAERNWRTD
jgi:hypothetical protein